MTARGNARGLSWGLGRRRGGRLVVAVSNRRPQGNQAEKQTAARPKRRLSGILHHSPIPSSRVLSERAGPIPRQKRRVSIAWERPSLHFNWRLPVHQDGFDALDCQTFRLASFSRIFPNRHVRDAPSARCAAAAGRRAPLQGASPLLPCRLRPPVAVAGRFGRRPVPSVGSADRAAASGRFLPLAGRGVRLFEQGLQPLDHRLGVGGCTRPLFTGFKSLDQAGIDGEWRR